MIVSPSARSTAWEAFFAAPRRSAQPLTRGGWLAGWEAIITYNFDDLMGEALDSACLARCAYGVSGEEMVGDPNAKAGAAGSRGLHQRIYHPHGCSLHHPFLITNTRFTFSTSQMVIPQRFCPTCWKRA